MAHLDLDNDPSLYQLEGSSGTEKGGLIIKKKQTASDADVHEFKKPTLPPPRVSLLGLDKLAMARRQQQADTEMERKKSHLSSYRDDEEVDVDMEDNSTQKRSYKERCVILISTGFYHFLFLFTQKSFCII